MATELKVGDPAPDFRATAVGGKYGSGREVSLGDFRGKSVVLYFYPKDDTPGCTTQACAMRDAWTELEARGEIFGVSVDSTKSHEKFIAKHQLPFPLLADVDHKMVEAYGVWVEKSMYGKKYMGIDRTTFVINPEGKIAAVLNGLKPDEHASAVLAALK